jgi:hypothetical protein
VKITLTTRGGQAAAINLRLAPRIVDLNSLPKAEAVELARLVDAAKKTPTPQVEPGLVADSMSYTITIEDNREPIVLHQSDANMSPAFAALLSGLEKHLASR